MRESASVIRVVIADDSDISATYLERLLEEDPQLRVVGRARNGAELLALPERSMAQVVILDVLMPEVGGLSVLRRLTAHCPVIAISSVAQGSAVPMEAMALGAFAFFSKIDLAHDDAALALREAVKAAVRGDAISVAKTHREPGAIVFVVGSTGAILPLEQLIRDLNGAPVPVLIVQHLPPGTDDTLPNLLNTGGARARLARHGAVVEPGIFVAPAGRHMELDSQGRIRLFDGPPVGGHRPSGDVLLRSALRLGPRAIAVMLPGLGNDGAEAMAELAAQGGACFAIHPDDCQASSMPRAALAGSRRVKSVRAQHLGMAVRRAAGHERS